MKKLLVLIVLLAIGLWVYYYISSRQPIIVTDLLTKLSFLDLPVDRLQGGGEDITFEAADGGALRGSWYSAKGVSQNRAIILLHQYGGSRHDFDSFIPVLVENGYSVLAYDMRGEPVDYPKDVPSAVTFVKNQLRTPKQKIGIIGASLGANVAFVASGDIPEVGAVVLLSPGVSGIRGQVVDAHAQPSHVLVMSNEGEWAEANIIFDKARDPKEQKMYPGFGHGVELLRSYDARADILRFLANML